MSEPGTKVPPNEAVATAARELVALVTSHLPQRFYGKHPWRMFSAAIVLRMADTVEATAHAHGCAYIASLIARTRLESGHLSCSLQTIRAWA